MRRRDSYKYKMAALAILSAWWILCSVPLGASAEEWWQEKKVPTIEELTGGKVKIGDTITKENVDLVREYLPPVIIELVNRGMVLKMGTEKPLDQRVPQYFLDYTSRYDGQAKVDENGTVYLQDGSHWPGGLPFKEPKTALEVMGNNKYGKAYDDLILTPYTMSFIGSDGEVYKTSERMQKILQISCRMKIPPLGSYPGMEDIKTKRITGQLTPIEAKGLGMVSTRYYDDTKKQDIGFLYLPAFKRTIRISASTWQDSVAGSDITYGDAEGFNEPYGYWTFKYLGEKYMLEPEPEPPVSYVSNEGRRAPTLQFTGGRKYPTVGWSIIPMQIIEATPKIRHIYSKKILYCRHPAYWAADQMYPYADIYDRAGQLWKAHVNFAGWIQHKSQDEHYLACCITDFYDLQADHTTEMFVPTQFQQNFKPGEFTLKSLLSYRR